MFDNGSYLRRRRRFKKKDAMREKEETIKRMVGVGSDRMGCPQQQPLTHSSSQSISNDNNGGRQTSTSMTPKNASAGTVSIIKL